MYDLNLKGPIGLVIGNEGEGVGRLVKEKCDMIASIPMKGDIDSLNASVAAGVLAYEIVRQRLWLMLRTLAKSAGSMKNYEEYQDEELIRRLRDGDGSVMDYLMEKYKDLVRRKARSMYLPGADQEDLIQEGMIGLFKAVRDYEKDRDASFSTFADLCISRQIYTAVEAGARKKHAPLNHYVSLSQPEDRDEDKQAYEPEDVWEKSPEELVIDQENTRLLEETIEQELTPLEKQVMDLHLTGMGYREIAKVLGRDGKSTDNALQRSRGKLRRALDKKTEQEKEVLRPY